VIGLTMVWAMLLLIAGVSGTPPQIGEDEL
jgi:hypothetical protein